MKRIVFQIFALVILMPVFSASGQIIVPKRDKASIPQAPQPEYSFCISLLPTANGGAATYGIHMLTVDKKVKTTFFTFDSFIRQFSGNEASRANPDRIDNLKKYGLNVQTIKEIWKLRYAQYPFGKSPEKGWGGQTGMPSEAQMQILAKYGVERIGDVIYGENLIRLLTDMEDPTWVQIYKNAQK